MKQFSKITPEFKYYYFGSYVHKNKKMSYKANFSPSELLCKSTLQWVKTSNALPLLDKNLVEFGEKKDEKDQVKMKVIDQSKVIHFGITCDGCKKQEFSGIRYKCETCENFDFCQSCYDKRQSHFNDKHKFRSIFNDEYGDSILVFYQERVTKLAQLELVMPLKKESKDKIELYQNIVGDEVTKSSIYYLRDSDFGLDQKNQKKEEPKKEEPKKEEVKKEEEMKPIPFTHVVDESKPLTKIQIFFHDGSRVVEKFNLEEKISNIFKVVDSQKPLKSYDLIMRDTKKPLSDLDKTIEDYGLKSASILQVKK